MKIAIASNLKIRDKLIIYFICLIILPLTIIFLITYLSLSDIVKNKISNYSSVIIREVCNDIDETLMSMTEAKYYILPNDEIQRILMKNSYDDVEFNQDSQLVQGYIMDIINAKEYVTSITIFNNKGHSFFYSRLQADEPYSIGDIKKSGFYDEMIKENGKMVWSGLDKSRNVYTVGMQLLSRARLKPIGVMIINFDMNEIERIFMRSKIEKYGKFFIIDKNEEVIFHSNKEKVGQKADRGLLEFINKTSSHIKTVYYESTRYITISYTSSMVEWSYIYYLPEKEMMKEIIFIRNFLIFVFSCGLILAIIFAVLISFGMTRPIEQLMGKMNKAEMGNFDTRVKVKTNDEIGQLGEKFNQMIGNIKNLINTVYKEELMRKNAEFKALQAQINPHFLYNTLDSINALAELKRVEEISKITVAFSRLLRGSISNDKNIVTLEEEISYITNYMTIIKIRHNNRIGYVAELEDNTLQCTLPKLIIQPLVENSIIHGLEDKIGVWEIQIKSWIEDNTLYIQVKDNGAGMDNLECDVKDERKGHTGVGLNNVKKRIELMYGEGYGIDIVSKKGEGTTVTLLLPAKSIFEGDVAQW